MAYSFANSKGRVATQILAFHGSLQHASMHSVGWHACGSPHSKYWPALPGPICNWQGCLPAQQL
eukprot:365164-Chlamydomonas_euryale.AAC.3